MATIFLNAFVKKTDGKSQLTGLDPSIIKIHY